MYWINWNWKKLLWRNNAHLHDVYTNIEVIDTDIIKRRNEYYPYNKTHLQLKSFFFKQNKNRFIDMLRNNKMYNINVWPVWLIHFVPWCMWCVCLCLVYGSFENKSPMRRAALFTRCVMLVGEHVDFAVDRPYSSAINERKV
jgi:hypothetical protein